MAYSHLGHNCEIGNNVVIANSVQIAGHVVVEDQTNRWFTLPQFAMQS